MSKAIPSKSQSDAIVVIGKLGRPYGVRGWLALQSFTEPRENILAYQPWRIQTGQNSDWVNVGDFLAKPHKDAFIAQINGIEDRDEAARLTGSLIGVSRQVIDVLEEDEYLWQPTIQPMETLPRAQGKKRRRSLRPMCWCPLPRPTCKPWTQKLNNSLLIGRRIGHDRARKPKLDLTMISGEPTPCG